MSAVDRRALGSTYRLQLNGLGFAGAHALVPVLDRLGVETMYVSPLGQARAGSSHGYDVIDPNRLDPALGTAAELETLLAALDERGMGMLVDIVPNHMAASPESPYFADVLRIGQASPYADWFDISWEEQDGRILLPVLGDALSDVIERGELRVVSEGPQGPTSLGYFDARFPLAPATVASAGEVPIDELLAGQHYRLADWHLANELVNYRRFFDINELIGVRQEDPAVFAATHRLTLELLVDPRVRGVRVDHVDGLRDPGGYLERLQSAAAELGRAPAVVVEKILEGEEQLPPWPVDGTTGYEIGAGLIRLFVEPVGATELSRATAIATGDGRSFGERAMVAKRKALSTLFPGQLARVAHALAAAMAVPDEQEVAQVLAELTAHLGVYRTYRQADVAAGVDDVGRLRLATMITRKELPAEAGEVLDAILAALLGPVPSGSVSWEAVAGWQQLSGPATAKGVEDTAMYDGVALLANADVGSDPDSPWMAPAQFHAAMARRAVTHPAGLSSTSTHDSKRSHDVRCRLAVLSEIATRWAETVEELDEVLAVTDDADGPDAADRGYLYQTLVGAWPLGGVADERFVSQVQACLLKSAREAKRHSTWADPNRDYEQALTVLAQRATTGRAGELLRQVVVAIECAGATNSLASVLLKSTVPGVPDTYQGDDDWFFALVDPDNRRTVDVGHHAKLLDEPTDRLLDQWRDGPLKQLVLRRSLHARRAHRAVYAGGTYEPLDVTGSAAGHVVAFARRHRDGCLVTVVPRLVQGLASPGRFAVGAEVWGDTRVLAPQGLPAACRELLTGRPMATAGTGWPVAELFAELPVALVDAAPQDTGDVD